MFNALAMQTTRYADAEAPLDPGLLAEAMLYYGQVTVFANRADIQQLLRVMQPDLLIEYLEAGFFKIVYLENMLAIMTNAADTPGARYDPVIAKMPHVALQYFAPEAFVETTGKPGRGRRLARRFQAKVEPYQFDDTLTTAARDDLVDSRHVHDCVHYILRLQVPEYTIPQPLVFNVHRDDRGFSVETNIDFSAANKIYHARIPATHSTLTPAMILSSLIHANGSLALGQVAGGDIATNGLYSGLLERKLNGVLRKRMSEQQQLAEFQSYLFKNAIALQQVINSGERTFKELLPILKKSRRLREWIAEETRPDNKLLDAYFSELRSQSWLDRLPTKTARWGIMSSIGFALDLAGAGGAGFVAAQVLSAFDALLLDRLIKGWRPTQFIEDDLGRFLQPNTQRRAG